MNWLEQIITALLKWLSNLTQTDTVANESKPDPDLRANLLRRIDAHERVLDKGASGAPRDAGKAGGVGQGPGVRS